LFELHGIVPSTRSNASWTGTRIACNVAGTAEEATPMRVPVDWGAPAGLLAALACAGCAYIDSISWLPSNQTRHSIAYSPPPSSRPPSYYAVRPGDTLGDIAFFYGVSVEALASANGIDDPDRIAVGERLLVPRPSGGTSVSAAPRSTSRHAAARKAAPADTTRAALEKRLRSADALVRAARFEEALTETEKARAPLGRLEASASADASTRAQRVRLELLAATASIALGRDAAAEQSFERALRADADLELDPARVSPKVVRRFDETRRRLASAEGAEAVAERAAAP
jgi:LysM repeat protein